MIPLGKFQRLRRLVLAIIIVAIAVALCFVRSAWGQAVHDLIEAVGLGVIVVGIIGRLWCTLYIGGRKSAEIVTVGPYSLCRNPLYFFSSVAAAGVGAQSGSILLSAMFFFACALAFAIVIKREEVHLSEEFGAPYDDYLRKVPRFWPNPFLFRDVQEVLVRPNRLYTTLADGIVFFVGKPALELIEYLQNAGHLKTYLNLY